MQKLMVLLGLAISTGAMAKIVETAPVTEGHIRYQSSANYVEAVDQQSGAVLWHTVLYPSVEPARYVPGLEPDVQWNIITRIQIDGGKLRVSDRKGQLYCLNKKSGAVEPC